MEFGDFILAVVRLALHKNLPDERGDGLDGVGTAKSPDHRQSRVRQARLNAVTDGPDLGFGWQRRQCLNRIIGHHIIKLAHQPLVRTEHNGANHDRIGLSFSLPNQGRLPPCPKACAQPQLHSVIVVGQRSHRFLVLSDAGSGHGLHRADDGLEIPGTANLAAQTRRGVAHDYSVSSGLGSVS